MGTGGAWDIDFALARYEGGSEDTPPPPDTTAPPEPAATPPAGTYREPQSVKLSSEAGARIHYTTDGSTPTSDDPRFDPASPIPVRESQTIEAIHGRYRNGVRLGRRGALLHDADTSARFDGTDDFVRVADRASLDTGDRFTLEAWVKRSGSSSSAKTVLSKGSGSYRLSFVNDVLTLTKAGAGTVARASVSTKDTTGFHHVVATKSGPTVRLYIDGVDRTGAVTNRRIANSSTALNVGRYPSGSEYFRGSIDEVAIYNVALSRAQVQRHFEASGR